MISKRSKTAAVDKSLLNYYIKVLNSGHTLYTIYIHSLLKRGVVCRNPPFTKLRGNEA